MNRLLLVIDVQNDFINEHTKNILTKIKELVDSNKYDLTAFTRFINDENSIWYKKLNYKGCMTKEGQAIAINTKNNKVFDKNIYTAVNDELKKYIVSGEIKPGEKLMSVRDLANVAKVNPNTMQKALIELEEKKLIYTPSTSGKYVTNDINVINSYKKKYLKNKTNEYLNTLRELGITNEEVMDYLREEMK